MKSIHTLIMYSKSHDLQIGISFSVASLSSQKIVCNNEELKEKPHKVFHLKHMNDKRSYTIKFAGQWLINVLDF